MFPCPSNVMIAMVVVFGTEFGLFVTGLTVLEPDTIDVDSAAGRPSSSISAIMVPNFDFNHQRWFDPEKSTEKLHLSQTRLNALLRSSMDPTNSDSLDLQRVVDADNQKLRDDIDRVHRLASEINSNNKRIQSLPIFRPSASVYDDLDMYSFLQIADNSTTIEDWSYCACGSGPNGTLVFPDRKWPNPQFLATVPPQTVNLTSSAPSASMLQIRINGRRLALKELPECNCTNPWESVDNTANMCKLINSVTVCLIHVSTKGPESRQEISAQAQALLDAIDKAVAAPSFMEIWTPFRFQL